MEGQISSVDKSETLFDAICRLAKAQDENGLISLIKLSDGLNSLQGDYTPVMQLAKEGELEAVEFLIHKFNANKNDAVRIAATQGHIELVLRLIADGADRFVAARCAAFFGNDILVSQLTVDEISRNWAIWGAGEGNQQKLVFSLLDQGASRNSALEGAGVGNNILLIYQLLIEKKNLDYAVRGAAAAGHTELVELLIANGASPHFAVWGAALGHRAELVSDLIKKGARLNYALWGAAAGRDIDLLNQFTTVNANRSYIVLGAEDGGHLRGNENDLLRFVACVNDRESRKLLLEAAKKNSQLNTKELSKVASTLNQIMQQYGFNFDQAFAWSKEECHIWFLQVFARIAELNDKIPAEILLYISTFVTGLSDIDNRTLFEKHIDIMPQKLLDASLKKLKADFIQPSTSSSLFTLFYWKKTPLTKEEYAIKQDQAIACYHKRRHELI